MESGIQSSIAAIAIMSRGSSTPMGLLFLFIPKTGRYWVVWSVGILAGREMGRVTHPLFPNHLPKPLMLSWIESRNSPVIRANRRAGAIGKIV